VLGASVPGVARSLKIAMKAALAIPMWVSGLAGFVADTVCRTCWAVARLQVTHVSGHPDHLALSELPDAPVIHGAESN
jgi:hypothetical protein